MTRLSYTVGAAMLCIELLLPSSAWACGGGGTFSEGGVLSEAQRIVFSVRDDGTTDVITQVQVGSGSSDYAVLIPLPSEPTLDATPVDAAELDQLEALTRVRVDRASSSDDDGDGSGCGSSKQKSAPPARAGGGLEVQAPVTIGPVVATALTANDAPTIKQWLTEHGYPVSADGEKAIATYAAKGRWFVAVRNMDKPSPNGPTSVGVHFRLQGDHRLLSLRFARVGAAKSLGFVVFVAAPSGVGPSDPFTALTVDDLEPNLVDDSYGLAVESAIRDHDGKAFVVEGVHKGLAAKLERTHLGTLLDSSAVVTRLSAIIETSTLDHDVLFVSSAPEHVPTTITLSMAPPPPAAPYSRPVGSHGTLIALLAIAVYVTVRKSQTALRSACSPPLPHGALRLGAMGLTMLGVACAPAAPAKQPDPPTPSPTAQPKPHCGTERECKTSPPFSSAQRTAQDRLVAEPAPGSNYSRASCEDEPYIEKWDAVKGWIKLVDERPPSHEAWRLYIGDQFVSKGGNEGCDVRGCNILQRKVDLGELAEYVKVGSKAAPKQSASDDELADVFERRLVTNAVRGSMLLSRGGGCAAPERVFAVP